MNANKEYKLIPGFFRSFSAGWNVMFDNFLRLFLVVIILAIVTSPLKMFDFIPKDGPFNFCHGWSRDISNIVSSVFTFRSLGIFAAMLGMLSMLYALLVKPVFSFGGKMIFLQAVRRIKPDFEYLIKGFSSNYLYIVLANLLAFALVALGLFALIIPGIIIACRLVFVSYIIMDKKLDPIEAVEMSWRLTRGHGWTIFFMGFVSIFIVIFGFIFFIVGIFPAIMWISSSFASLYESVLREKENQQEKITA